MTSIDPSTITKEARASFSPMDRLRGRVLRSDKITLFTDEETGFALGGSEARTRIVSGLEIPDVPRRWGILGMIHDLEQDNEDGSHDEQLAELRERAEVLRAKLAETSLTFHLQALPDTIVEAARAAARSALGIEGEEIPEDRQAEFNTRYSGEFYSRVIVAVTDNAGASGTRLTPEDCIELGAGDALPRDQYRRLARKISELQWANSIAEDAVDNLDF